LSLEPKAFFAESLGFRT